MGVANSTYILCYFSEIKTPTLYMQHKIYTIKCTVFISYSHQQQQRQQQQQWWCWRYYWWSSWRDNCSYCSDHHHRCHVQVLCLQEERYVPKLHIMCAKLVLYSINKACFFCQIQIITIKHTISFVNAKLHLTRSFSQLFMVISTSLHFIQAPLILNPCTTSLISSYEVQINYFTNNGA